MRLFSKIIKYEFWPFWVFYVPAYFYGLYLALRARSFTYFTATNTCMKYAGAFAYSKHEITQHIAPKYLPKTLFLNANYSREDIEQKISNQKFEFPLILKPEVGERGVGIELCKNFENLWAGLSEINCGEDAYLIQEFIDFEMEVGVLYYRFPDKSQRGIISMITKDFYTVTGDGKRSIEQLVGKDIRIAHRKEYLKKKFGSRWLEVPPREKKIIIEEIGNHSRGTKFIDANHLISADVFEFLDEISDKIPGFFYGRFDIKLKDLDSFSRKDDLKIIEINGVNSEAAHIYDPGYSLTRAYRDVFRQMRLIFQISQQNRKLGVEVAKLPLILKDLMKHLKR